MDLRDAPMISIPLASMDDPIEMLCSMGYRPKYTELQSNDSWHLQGSADIRPGFHKVSDNIMMLVYYDITGAKRNVRFFQIPNTHTMLSKEKRDVKRVDGGQIWKLAKQPKRIKKSKEIFFTKNFVHDCSEQYKEKVGRLPTRTTPKDNLKNDIRLSEALENQYTCPLQPEEPYIKFERHVNGMAQTKKARARKSSKAAAKPKVTPPTDEKSETASLRSMLNILNVDPSSRAIKSKTTDASKANTKKVKNYLFRATPDFRSL